VGTGGVIDERDRQISDERVHRESVDRVVQTGKLVAYET